MKKSILLLAGVMMLAGSASAQMNVVKEAMKAISPSATVEQMTSVLQQLQPTLTNAETMNTADAWFAAGKASFQLYDAYSVAQIKGQTANPGEMAQALLNGYNYFKKALPLDTVIQTDKNGNPKIDKKTGQAKFKVKYSNEILSTLKGHASDFGNVANTCLAEQKWAEAQSAFNLYADMLQAQNPDIHDSIMSEIRFFQGYSAYNNKDYNAAFTYMTDAKLKGYTQNQVAEFQYSALGNIAQSYIDANKAADALSIIDNAIAKEPNNGNFYNLKGILVERSSNLEAALPYFQQAAQIDPTSSQAQFNIGRYYYNQAFEFEKNNPNLLGKELNDKVNPLYKNSLPYLEKAYQLDNTNTDAKNALRNIYYRLGDTAKYEELSK